jgi:deoxyinosine 3'endonuclease (endonuclease V)
MLFGAGTVWRGLLPQSLSLKPCASQKSPKTHPRTLENALVKKGRQTPWKLRQPNKKKHIVGRPLRAITTGYYFLDYIPGWLTVRERQTAEA